MSLLPSIILVLAFIKIIMNLVMLYKYHKEGFLSTIRWQIAIETLSYVGFFVGYFTLLVTNNLIQSSVPREVLRLSLLSITASGIYTSILQFWYYRTLIEWWTSVRS